MEENRLEEDLTIEEKLNKANLDIDTLLTNLQSKKEEYTNILEDLKTQKTEIDNVIKEIKSAKNTFVDDVNTKLENYEMRFKEKDDDIETQKNDFNSLYDGLEVKFNNLVAEYETNAKNKIKEINDSVLESKNILDKEKTAFNTFIADNKANFDKEYTEISTLVTKYNTTTTESLSNIEKREKTIITSQAKIEKIEADCQVIKDAISEYISNMNNKTKEIDEKTKQFTEDTQNIINKNNEQTTEIEKQLRLATGRSLFYSFHKRKKDLEIGQWIWLAVLGLSILLLTIFSWQVVVRLAQIDWQNTDMVIKFLFKLLLPLPLVYLVAFVTDRYTKERRLLEEYAFKSTISLALKPYFDMVASSKITEEEREFLIKSIENIFSTPTDKVYRTKECQNKIDISHLTELTKQLENKVNEK